MTATSLSTTRSQTVSLRYWAFIAYDPADAAVVEWLHDALETYVIPKAFWDETDAASPVPRRLFPVFLDCEELPFCAYDAAPEEHIFIGLQQSRHLIVVCSPASAGSPDIEEQVRYFLSLEGGRRIACLLVDGRNSADKVAGDGGDLLPACLRKSHVVGDPPPFITVDMRAGRAGKQDARLRLVAAIANLDFPSLQRRDRERGLRQLQMTLTGIIALGMIFLGIGVELFRQRSLAIEAGRIALEERRAAERERDRAILEKQKAGESPTRPQSAAPGRE